MADGTDPIPAKPKTATALFNLGNSSNAFLILRTQDIGVSLRETILIYAAFNLAAAVVSNPAGLLSDRIGRKSILLGSFFIFIVAYLGFALTRNYRLVIALFIFYGLFQGIYRAVGKSLASDFVPAPMRASGIGWYGTAVGVFQLIASLIAGILWDRVSHTAVFFYGAGCAAVGNLALWWSARPSMPALGPAGHSGGPPA